MATKNVQICVDEEMKAELAFVAVVFSEKMTF